MYADDVTNYYLLNDELVITKKFEDNYPNTYKICDMSTRRLADIENKDTVVITNYNGSSVIFTDKGIYKLLESN